MQDEFKRLAVAEQHGIFRRQLSLFQGIALIVSGTIGAGILGIPYAVSKAGVGIGLIYIVGLGFLMMGLNLLVGEIAMRAKTQLQLAGLAETFLGKTGKWIMTALVFFLLFGVLTVYIIGVGEGLAALFGGPSKLWSVIFFGVGSALVWFGIRTVKTAEFFLLLGVLAVVIALSAFSLGHITAAHLLNFNQAYVFLPYGVVLFALHGVTAIPEAYSLLVNKEQTFRKAIVISGIIVIAVYALFTLMVVGVTGRETTEIATIGLGRALGPFVFLLGNVFAVLAMSTSFLMVSLALRDSLRWDFRLPAWAATVAVCAVPIAVFLLGAQNFIGAIEVVGGVGISLEMLFILLIYLRARRRAPFHSIVPMRHASALVLVLALALSAGAVYSIVRIF